MYNSSCPFPCIHWHTGILLDCQLYCISPTTGVQIRAMANDGTTCQTPSVQNGICAGSICAVRKLRNQSTRCVCRSVPISMDSISNQRYLSRAVLGGEGKAFAPSCLSPHPLVKYLGPPYLTRSFMYFSNITTNLIPFFLLQPWDNAYLSTIL